MGLNRLSLIASTILLSSTIFVNSANAAPGCNQDANPLECERTMRKYINAADSTFTITENGSIRNSADPVGILLDMAIM